MIVEIDGKLQECKQFRVVCDTSVPPDASGWHLVHIRQFVQGTQGEVRTIEKKMLHVYQLRQPDFGLRLCADVPVHMSNRHWVVLGSNETTAEIWPAHFDIAAAHWYVAMPCPKTLNDWRDKYRGETDEAYNALVSRS